MTDDRSGMLQSPAYLAMTPVGRRVLRLIEDTINRSGGSAVTLTRSSFGGHRGSISFGIKQCERLGFVSIGIGLRRANAFSLLDDWRAVDADEAARRVQLAKLPQPPRPSRAVSPKPPKPVKPSKPVAVAPPTPQRQVTLPRLSFMDDGR